MTKTHRTATRLDVCSPSFVERDTPGALSQNLNKSFCSKLFCSQKRILEVVLIVIIGLLVFQLSNSTFKWTSLHYNVYFYMFSGLIVLQTNVWGWGEKIADNFYFIRWKYNFPQEIVFPVNEPGVVSSWTWLICSCKAFNLMYHEWVSSALSLLMKTHEHKFANEPGNRCITIEPSSPPTVASLNEMKCFTWRNFSSISL